MKARRVRAKPYYPLSPLALPMTASSSSSPILDAVATAERLPYADLASAIARLLRDSSVQVPPRLVQPLSGGGSLFVMPAADDSLAITKLISYTPANAGTARPAIQGDVVVFDVGTGERRLILHGPTVTARRTAAVSLLAAQQLAPEPQGPLLIVGAGVQGRAHLEAFVLGLDVKDVRIVSRSAASAQALAAYAQTLGVRAQVVADANAALSDCPLVITCTPAREVVLYDLPRQDAFVAAVGAFTPQMVELAPELCRYCATLGTVVLDTREADHEAGDLLQAGLGVSRFDTLGDVIRGTRRHAAPTGGPILFKSCGWAGWDLAAAQLAVGN